MRCGISASKRKKHRRLLQSLFTVSFQRLNDCCELFFPHTTHPRNAPGRAPPLAQEAQGPQEWGEHGPEGAHDLLDGAPEGEEASDGDGEGEGGDDLRVYIKRGRVSEEKLINFTSSCYQIYTSSDSAEMST